MTALQFTGTTMGYFAHLYIADASVREDAVEVDTSVFGGDVGSRAYFTWIPSRRTGDLVPYAHDTIFSDTRLRLLPGYPRVETYEVGGGPSGQFLLDASFHPRDSSDPVLFHLLLPEHYVPLRGNEPFTQPCEPSVSLHGNRFIATYPVIGPATIRFWIGLRREADSLDTYDSWRIFRPDEREQIRPEFEFNLGIFKVKLTRRPHPRA